MAAVPWSESRSPARRHHELVSGAEFGDGRCRAALVTALLGTLAKCSRLTPALAMLVAPVVSTCVRRWFTGSQSCRPSVMGLLEHLSSCRQYPDTRGAPNSSSAVPSQCILHDGI